MRPCSMHLHCGVLGHTAALIQTQAFHIYGCKGLFARYDVRSRTYALLLICLSLHQVLGWMWALAYCVLGCTYGLWDFRLRSLEG